jgi:hypothetical protein
MDVVLVHAAYVPYRSLESVIEQSKEAYYLALRQTQGTIRAEDCGTRVRFPVEN